MKIIHISDLHLNSAMNALSGEKSKIRKEEIIHTFERIVDYAKSNGVSAIIIAGDMFDTSNVAVRLQSRIIHNIISNPEISFFYLSGNHDQDNFIKGLETIPQNLIIFNNEWSYFKIGDVCICGVCLNSVNSVSIYNSLILDENAINIAVLHGQIAGYVNSNEGEIISIPRLRDKFIDYLALGHYHSYSEGEVDLRGKYVYSGCPDGRGFDETGDKGFVLLETNDKKICHQFISFSSRKLFEVEYELDKTVGWYETQNKIIAKLSEFSSDSLIKLVIKGSHCIDYDVDIDNLQNKLNKLFFYVKVVDKTSLQLSEDDYLLDKSVRGEFVRGVMASNLSDELKNKIIMCGLKALKGEFNEIN